MKLAPTSFLSNKMGYYANLYELNFGLIFMLETLCNNTHIEKILLFLFINQKGYPSQVKKRLDLSLTPLQHAFNKLEQGQVISSYFVGNKKVYELNLQHPYYPELEAFLKKRYTFLPPIEKNTYLMAKASLTFSEELEKKKIEIEELSAFWEVLKKVKKLKFTAKTIKDEDTETRFGYAQVTLTESKEELIFDEKGFWHLDEEPNMAFSNTFRWRLDLKNQAIAVEHLRYGVKNPIFLFYLKCHGKGQLISENAHHCREDIYLATCSWNKKKVVYQWRILGPKKNQFLTYEYST